MKKRNYLLNYGHCWSKSNARSWAFKNLFLVFVLALVALPLFSGNDGTNPKGAAMMPPLLPDLPITFEDQANTDYALFDFGGASSIITIDPTNAANTVVCTTKPAGSEWFAGTVAGINGMANPVPFTATEMTMTVRVWSPAAGIPVLLKVENAIDPGIISEVLVHTTVAMQWETMIFDFNNGMKNGQPAPPDLGITYEKVVIFFDFGIVPAADATYYWDDIMFCPAGGGCVANDDCINAEPIDCGQTIFGNTTIAAADDEIYCGTGNGTGGGVWYTWTGNGEGVELTTCGAGTNYDTRLRVYSGSCGDLACVGGDDDEFGTCSFSGLQSRVAFVSIPGTQYFILVHGFQSNEGNFELSLTCDPLPTNDDVCDALPIDLGVPIAADLTFATAQPGEVSPGPGTGFPSCNSQDGWCSFETDVDASFWYTFVAPASGKINIETVGGDTQLALWEVGDCNDFASFTEVAANDDGGPGLAAAIFNACVTPGNTYYIQVDDYGGGPTFAAFEMVLTAGEATINCPPDVSIPCGSPTDPGVTGEATGDTDACCPNPPVITYSDVTIPGVSVTRTWTATYDCGQVVTCDQVITFDPTPYVGNVAFYTQAQVDAWLPCYSSINGHVQIIGANITNLGPLQNITSITGGLTIQSTGLSNMNGLGNLTNVGGTLTIYFNSSLTSLTGLESLASVGGAFYMYYNFLLNDCCAVHTLINGGVTGPVLIFFNKVGCNSVMEINNNCAPPPLVGNQQGSLKVTGSDLQVTATLSLFPNPAKNEVNVQFDRTAPSATLRVMDMLGRVVFEKELGDGMDRLTIDLNNGQFENGLYLVSLFENGEMRTKQLVVQL